MTPASFLLFLRQFTVFLDGDHVALIQCHIMGIAQIIRNGLPGEVTAVFRLIQIYRTKPAAPDHMPGIPMGIVLTE